jgi:hypothetical protein
MRVFLVVGLLAISGVSWAGDNRLEQYPPGWEHREMRRHEEMRRERWEARERERREWCWHHPRAC